MQAKALAPLFLKVAVSLAAGLKSLSAPEFADARRTFLLFAGSPVV